MLKKYRDREIFSSESVSEGHPDKVADQISDGILDEILIQDPYGRVACEVLVNSQFVVISGEISSQAQVCYETIARRVLTDIGYNHESIGLDGHSCRMIIGVNEQSSDIAVGVNRSGDWGKKLGAGDQGLMFGYACDETSEYMPAPIYYAHLLLKTLSHKRRSGAVNWLRPDAKSQVTVAYKEGKIDEVTCVVLSCQHSEDISYERLRQYIIEEVIQKTIPREYLKNTEYLINPTGVFVTGGTASDTGLTGRKIIVDTYGGRGAHGGGAFSGKDPTKVDRSAAYMARYIAKNLVASGAMKRCLIQIAYAIGVASPVSIWLDHGGTSRYSNAELYDLIEKNFSLEPTAIIDRLKLRRPIYLKTAAYGHFGRKEFSWEKTDVAQLFV